MAETAGPFDGTDLTEAEWELMLGQLVDGVLSGLSATVSGSTVRGVDIAAGIALAAGHWFRNDAVKTVASAANGTSSSRIDRAVLRLDRTANTVTIAVLTGTAGSSTPPPLTDNATVTERPLKRWTVPAGGTAVTGITDEAQSLGRGVKACTSTNRPINPRAGDLAAETDTLRWVGWNGTTWVVVRDDTDWVPLAIGSAFWAADNANPMQARRVNGIVYMRGAVVRKGGTLSTVDESMVLTMPAGFRPPANHYFVGWIYPAAVQVRITSDGSLTLRSHSMDVPNGRQFTISTTFMVD